ncbi:hypothetical protein SAMN00768000_0316 [Sulfobacillus thermosulfidooxidans DSM 9293]|uniref:Uncharacterized protein n=1 Tax=Sulfobacillus thermosulfidooxidans (strain DSM 9293 / VKM B-1269 / AT-1) TaxID=929705 RepID=A0A1W1W8M6_SULTA|nr:hypothetical protein [Sulfobacillus thermosulfidooxidans]SMC02103.1 hypothetical protein SAMN00768000_0316 [Sulfobacillus thermosulfidooxidans DSM 9293]
MTLAITILNHFFAQLLLDPLLPRLVVYRYQLSVTVATLIAGLGGSFLGGLIGFGASRSSAWLDDQKRRKQFLIGLSQDVKRCQTIDLSISSDSLQLLNPISFPFIRQIAQGQYVHLFSPDELTALLKLFYLTENFLRFQEPEMQILLDSVRRCKPPPTGQLKHLRSHAIAPLQSALRSEAANAYKILKEHGNLCEIADKTRPHRPDNQNFKIAVSIAFPNFHDQLRQKLQEGGFSESYTLEWNSDENALICQFNPQRTLIITNVPQSLLETPSEDNLDKISHKLLAWAQSQEQVHTVDFNEC